MLSFITQKCPYPTFDHDRAIQLEILKLKILIAQKHNNKIIVYEIFLLSQH